MKQKEAFDIQYKFLRFVEPSLTHIREIGKKYGRIECVRCNRTDEKQKPWFFSCSSSQSIFIQLLCLLEYVDITQVIDNTVEDCLLYHLSEHEKEVPENTEIYFLTIRYLRKEAQERNHEYTTRCCNYVKPTSPILLNPLENRVKSLQVALNTLATKTKLSNNLQANTQQQLLSEQLLNSVFTAVKGKRSAYVQRYVQRSLSHYLTYIYT